MPEPDNMSTDPLAAKLADLAPVPVVIDRDAIFFQAGQASRRRNRLWPGLTAFLAATQAATLVLWMGLPKSMVSPGSVAPDSLAQPLPGKTSDPPVDPAPSAAQRDLLPETGGSLALLQPAAKLVKPEPPLTVASAYHDFK
jgi:hypothetical protein